MNYRHAYHAGNFADCFKHALLVALVEALRRKPAPFSVLDTHAGIGRYDLSSPEAQATGEWREGVGRLLSRSGDDLTPLQPWLDIVRKTLRPVEGGETGDFTGFYPGSPATVAALLRPQDELVCCELHPEDQRPLRRLFRGSPEVSIHHRDGYEAVTALLPPRMARRGLVLIDPPFERTDEFARLTTAVAQAHARFAAGVIAVWYPVKHRAPVRAFFEDLKAAGLRNLLNVEFTLRPPHDPSRLNGCGLLIANPPYRFEDEARAILAPLCRYLGDDEAKSAVEWIVPE